MPLYFFYTMVQKSQKWPKTQIGGGGGSCLKALRLARIEHCSGTVVTPFLPSWISPPFWKWRIDLWSILYAGPPICTGSSAFYEFVHAPLILLTLFSCNHMQVCLCHSPVYTSEALVIVAWQSNFIHIVWLDLMMVWPVFHLYVWLSFLKQDVLVALMLYVLSQHSFLHLWLLYFHTLQFWIIIEYVTKNHQGGSGRDQNAVSAGRIVVPGQVEAIRNLLRQLNPRNDQLFQYSIKGSRTSHERSELECWFTETNLGKTPCQWWCDTVRESLFSRRYTPHSVRASPSDDNHEALCSRCEWQRCCWSVGTQECG